MIRLILVPLDGSRFAETAIPAARALARSAHATLRLVLCHGPISADEERGGGRSDRTSGYLADTGFRIAGGGVRVESMTLEGDAAESLPRLVRELMPDLVVMASHRRGETLPAFPSSVAHAILRSGGIPVLLVPPDSDDPLGPAIDFRSILFPVSLTEANEPAAAAIAAFAGVMESHVTLLHVVVDERPDRPDLPAPVAPGSRSGRSGQPHPPPGLEDTCRAAQRRLDELADALRERGVRAAARVRYGHSVTGTILAELAGGPTRLLAIMPRARSGSGWDAAPSVIDEVIANATNPVLVLSPTAVETPA